MLNPQIRTWLSQGRTLLGHLSNRFWPSVPKPVPDVTRFSLHSGFIDYDDQRRLCLFQGDDSSISLEGQDDPYVVRLKVGRDVRMVMMEDQVLAVEDESHGIVYPTNFKRISASQPFIRRINLGCILSSVAVVACAESATALLPPGPLGASAFATAMQDLLSNLNPGASESHILFARVALVVCCVGVCYAIVGAVRARLYVSRVVGPVFNEISRLFGRQVTPPKRLSGLTTRVAVVVVLFFTAPLWSAVATHSASSNPQMERAQEAMETLRPYTGTTPVVINSKIDTWLALQSSAPAFASVRVSGIKPSVLDAITSGVDDDGRLGAHCKTYVSRAAGDEQGSAILVAVLPTSHGARCAVHFSRLLPNGSVQVASAANQ